MTNIEEVQSETVKAIKMYAPETMKLTSSASEQNVYVTYVCLINDIKPNEHVTSEYGHNKPLLHPIDLENPEDPDEESIQVERTRALHELIESPKKSNNTERANNSSSPYLTTAPEDNKQSDHDDNPPGCDNPNILKLTKMKWLSEEQDSGEDSSSPSLSPTGSTTSSCSNESQGQIEKHDSFGDRYLSTILRLDREHNMFGLSNIAIVGSRPSKKIKKEDDRAVFHQTAIVQICCGKGCCRHKSNTDMPSSLKCGGCRSWWDPFCATCVSSCGTPSYYNPPCSKLCSSCPKGKCTCKGVCPPGRCVVDCSTCYGMKISLHKPQKYEPGPAELTPKSSCVLQKPVASRSCHHIPQCIPPSSCFPYLMPCFWPARPAAPCSIPAQCFHNPPCPAPRKPRPPPPLPDDSCIDKRGLCNNEGCGKSESTIIQNEQKKKKRNKKISTCECSSPPCVSCFVSRPKSAPTKSGVIVQNNEESRLK